MCEKTKCVATITLLRFANIDNASPEEDSDGTDLLNYYVLSVARIRKVHVSVLLYKKETNFKSFKTSNLQYLSKFEAFKNKSTKHNKWSIMKSKLSWIPLQKTKQIHAVASNWLWHMLFREYIFEL